MPKRPVIFYNKIRPAENALQFTAEG